MKIVLIGAGSHSFGFKQVVDVMLCSDFIGRGVTLALVDEDKSGVVRMAAAAERLRTVSGTDVRVESHTDRTAALPGADYVIVSVARRRYELWEQDFRVPLAHGFRQILGENGGPGALFHALRSFELVLPICRDIERLCPTAYVLNFTNPEARVLHAVGHLTTVRVFGFCHGVFQGLAKVAEYLDRSVDDLDITSAGMNHFYCLLNVRDRATGENRLAEAVGKAAADADAPPLFRRMAQVFGVFTFPSDDHIGEYLNFGTEFHGTAWKYGREKKRVLRTPQTAATPVLDYIEGRRAADDPELIKPSEELTVPIICDIELDRGIRRPAVNVVNSDGCVANLPRHAAVEVPVSADAQGIHPEHVGSIPDAFAAFMRPQFEIHRLLTEAYRTGSKRLLLQALCLDPVVDSSIRAEAMLDDMLTLQEDWLPDFA